MDIKKLTIFVLAVTICGTACPMGKELQVKKKKLIKKVTAPYREFLQQKKQLQNQLYERTLEEQLGIPKKDFFSKLEFLGKKFNNIKEKKSLNREKKVTILDALLDKLHTNIQYLVNTKNSKLLLFERRYIKILKRFDLVIEKVMDSAKKLYKVDCPIIDKQLSRFFRLQNIAKKLSAPQDCIWAHLLIVDAIDKNRAILLRMVRMLKTNNLGKASKEEVKKWKQGSREFLLNERLDINFSQDIEALREKLVGDINVLLNLAYPEDNQILISRKKNRPNLKIKKKINPSNGIKKLPCKSRKRSHKWTKKEIILDKCKWGKKQEQEEEFSWDCP